MPMEDLPQAPVLEPAPTAGPDPGPKKKKKDKVRSAWISFIGRIVAQVVGAVASIVLAVLFLQKAQSNDEREPPAHVVAPRPEPRPAAARADGHITLAVLPLPITRATRNRTTSPMG